MGETRGDRPEFHPTSCTRSLVRMFKIISLVNEQRLSKHQPTGQLLDRNHTKFEFVEKSLNVRFGFRP